jgi:hypothetical protein
VGPLERRQAVFKIEYRTWRTGAIGLHCPVDASVAENTISVSLQRVSLVSGVLQVRPVEEGLRASRRAAPSLEICTNTVLSWGVLICSIGNWGAAAIVTRLVAEVALAYFGMLPSDQPQAPTQG